MLCWTKCLYFPAVLMRSLPWAISPSQRAADAESPWGVDLWNFISIHGWPSLFKHNDRHDKSSLQRILIILYMARLPLEKQISNTFPYCFQISLRVSKVLCHPSPLLLTMLRDINPKPLSVLESNYSIKLHACLYWTKFNSFPLLPNEIMWWSVR